MEGAERLRWIDFNSNRQYTLSVDGRVSETGDWQLTDGLVLTPKPQREKNPAVSSIRSWNFHRAGSSCDN
jgi:hypothetical protein